MESKPFLFGAPTRSKPSGSVGSCAFRFSRTIQPSALEVVGLCPFISLSNISASSTGPGHHGTLIGLCGTERLSQRQGVKFSVTTPWKLPTKCPPPPLPPPPSSLTPPSTSPRPPLRPPLPQATVTPLSEHTSGRRTYSRDEGRRCCAGMSREQRKVQSWRRRSGRFEALRDLFPDGVCL